MHNVPTSQGSGPMIADLSIQCSQNWSSCDAILGAIFRTHALAVEHLIRFAWSTQPSEDLQREGMVE